MKFEITQKYKDLLLKDLSNRLQYNVKIHEEIQGDFTLIGLVNDRVITNCEVDGCHNNFPIEIIKPYLFPFSSMTEEQRLEIEILTNGTIGIDQYSLWDFTGYSELCLSTTLELIQWLYENHFDVNGLIHKGLAIDATGLNIY
jgi:hypothetical protein